MVNEKSSCFYGDENEEQNTNFDLYEAIDSKDDYRMQLLREQPYYHYGMSKEDVIAENNYLNNHIEEFYDGTYSPLWKQNFYR